MPVVNGIYAELSSKMKIKNSDIVQELVKIYEYMRGYKKKVKYLRKFCRM